MDTVRSIRKARGWSQQRLAEEAGVNKVTVVYLETGKSSPTVETLEKLADALDVEVGDFFPKVEPPLFLPDTVREPRRDALQDYVQALDQKRKRDLALAAKGDVSDVWLGATSSREARDVKQLAEEYGVEVADVLEALVRDTPGLADMLDRFEARARELAARLEEEITVELENEQGRDLA